MTRSDWRIVADRLFWLLFYAVLAAALLACDPLPSGKTRPSPAVAPTAGALSPPAGSRPAAGVVTSPVAATQPVVVVDARSTPPPVSRVTLPDGTVVEAPAGQPVTVERVGGSLRRSDRATSAGGEAMGKGDEVKDQSSTVPGSISLEPLDARGLGGGGGSGTTGGIESRISAVGVKPSQAGLYAIGALMIAAGLVVAIWAGQVLLGIALAIAGVAVIASGVLIDRYPWVLAVGAVAALGAGVWWVIANVKTAKAADAMGVTARSSVLAIDSLKTAALDPSASAWSQHAPAIYAWLKGMVDYHTDSRDDGKLIKTVAKIKGE